MKHFIKMICFHCFQIQWKKEYWLFGVSFNDSRCIYRKAIVTASKYCLEISYQNPLCSVKLYCSKKVISLYLILIHQSKKCTVSPLFSPYSSYLWIWTADELSWDVKVNVHKNTLFEASGKKIKFNLPLVSHSTAVELLFIYQMSSDMYEQWVHWQTLGIISCSIWKCD